MNNIAWVLIEEKHKWIKITDPNMIWWYQSEGFQVLIEASHDRRIAEAAERVKSLIVCGKKDLAIDLFCAYDQMFEFDNDSREEFASLCGYGIAKNVEEIE